MIKVVNLRHLYRGTLFTKPTVGARDISVDVSPGEIHGFLGPNGSGKSTTIKAVLGLLKPDGGTLELFGQPIAKGQWRARVGYMPEHPTFYDFLTGWEMVTWFGRLAGLSRHEAEKEASKQLDRVGLAEAKTRRIRGYSKGMLQRSGLAQALLGSPELLILDEPMTGLDPIGRKEIRELIVALRDEGKTVFYSTHILPDIEMTCDRVTIVSEGTTRQSGRLQDILTETTRGVTVTVSQVAPEVVEHLRSQHASLVVVDGELTLELRDFDDASRLVGELVTNHGARVHRFEPHRDDLETIFVRSLGAPPEEHK